MLKRLTWWALQHTHTTSPYGYPKVLVWNWGLGELGMRLSSAFGSGWAVIKSIPESGLLWLLPASCKNPLAQPDLLSVNLLASLHGHRLSPWLVPAGVPSSRLTARRRKYLWVACILAVAAGIFLLSQGSVLVSPSEIQQQNCRARRNKLEPLS